jgi:hypothetical protein
VTEVRLSDFERWICDTFRRSGGDLHVGPIAHPVALVREDVEKLVGALTELAAKLPDLDKRLAGLSTCELCDGEAAVHDVDEDTESDCPACEGRGLAPRPATDF